MLKMSRALILLSQFIVVLFFYTNGIFAQNKTDKKVVQNASIGGKEHEANIYGVTIGMDVPTALQAVFVNANRKLGQEKPDAKKNEGKNKSDVRIVYKNLPQGELQIVLANGKYVKEMLLVYSKPLNIDDLRLPFTSSLGNSTSSITTSTVEGQPVSNRTDTLDGTRELDGFNATNTANTDRRRGEALDGTRYDDRYTIAFVDNQKLQRLWWREEKAKEGYKVRVQFVSEKTTKAGATFVVKVAQKAVFLKPEDEVKFRKSLNLEN